jgi:hypothetical protein
MTALSAGTTAAMSSADRGISLLRIVQRRLRTDDDGRAPFRTRPSSAVHFT